MKKIEIRVDGAVYARKGTLKWFRENVSHVAIGVGTDKQPIARLIAKDGGSICCLVWGTPDGPVILERALDESDYLADWTPPDVGFAVTDAAWKFIENLAKQALESIRAIDDEEEGIDIVVVRTANREIESIARGVPDDARAIPVLTDRVLEEIL